MADIEQLSVQITSDAKEAVSGIDALAASLEKLDKATRGLGFSKVSSDVGGLSNATKTAAKSNDNFSKSFMNLSSKINAARNVIMKAYNAISKCVGETNDYIENVNLFNVAMGEYAKEAGEYAEKVGEIMGIDPGEWMRNQGLFMTLATGFGVVSDRAYIMSKNLTQLGYDISSFFNIPYEDAMEKLQSGLAGELEPLRRIGYDLSQARLQQEAYILGIDKKISKMTQAEKAELRYHAIMTQVTVAQGDMARTLNAPANQLRIFTANVTQAARAIGSIFIPLLNAVLPYLTAFARLIRDVAANIAAFFGFEMPEVDYSGVNGLASGADDAANSLGNTSNALDDAADKAKKLKKYTMGFDELNVIDPTAGSSKDSSGDSGIGTGSGFDFTLPEYDFLSGALSKQIDALKTALGMTISDVFLEWGSELNAENILEKIVTGLGIIGGAILGFKLGGFKGAVLGILVGTAMSLAINSLVFDHDGNVSFTELFDLLRDLLIVGAGASVGFAVGGLKGAAIGLTIGFSLAMLLEAVEMKGDASVAHGLENALMGLVPVGLGVGFGKQFGLDFLQGFDTSFGAGEGFGKSISGGLTSISGSLTDFQKGLVGVVGGITEFLGVFTGVKNIVYDVSNGSTTLSSVFSGLIPIVAGLTAGFIAFSIAFNSTGIGLLVTILVAAVAALGGAIAGIVEAGQAAYEASEDFKIMEGVISDSDEIISRCANSIDTMKGNIANLDKVSYDFAMASSLVDEIFDINENANASAYELALMESKVEILNGLGIDGLALSIDETTGRVIQTRESVEKLIESLEKEAQMEAMRELLVQTYKDQYQAMADVEKASNAVDVAGEALLETNQELAECPWYDLGRRAELTAAQKKEQEAVDKAVEAYTAAKQTVGELDSTIETYTQGLTDMKLEEMGIGDELVNGVGQIEDALTETAKKTPELGKAVADGVKSGVTENTKKTDYESVWSKIGNWFKDLFGIHSPSTVFAGYGKNILDGLFNTIRDKFSKGKETVVKWATSVKDWFTGTGSDNILTKFKSYATDIVSNFKTEVSEKYTTIKEKMTTWSKSIKDWFTGTGSDTIFTKFTSYATDIVSNFKTEVQGKYTTVKDKMTTWSTSIKDWFTGTGDDSIFSKFKSYATEIIGGFDGKVKEKYTDTKGNLETWSKGVCSWFSKPDGEQKTIFDKFTQFGTDITGNLKTSIDGGVAQSDYDTFFGRIGTALSGVKSTIAGIINSILGFIEGMANGVVRGINAVINALNRLKIDVPDWVTDKFGISSFGFNIPTLSEISIPRVRLMADGGFVKQGQLFIAREAGAEMVGGIGRHTAVANNEQIVSGIASGVASANSEQNALLREQNNLLRALLEKETDVSIDGKSLSKSIDKQRRDRGRALVTGGAY